MFRFLHWYWLLLIPVVSYLILSGKNKGKLKFSSVQLIKQSGASGTIKHKIGKFVLLLGISLLLIGLARPQSGAEQRNVQQSGVDIVLALDASDSMKSVDFEPNRLEVAKEVITKFIDGRPHDRLGLVAFSGTAFTKLPLTLDHRMVRRSLQKLTADDISKEGTAIGMGVSVAVNRLKKSEAESKVIILVTDGENNVGQVNPETAARLAKKMGIKVYTIGIGSSKTIIPRKVQGETRYQRVKGGLNEELLTEIAETTGGEYFRAREEESLSDIFDQIDKLETTEFEASNYFEYKELAFRFIKAGLLLLVVGIVLDRYLFIKIP